MESLIAVYAAWEAAVVLGGLVTLMVLVNFLGEGD